MINVTGTNIYVFSKEINGNLYYTTTITQKDFKTQQETKKVFPIQFKKGYGIEKNGAINIKKGFLSFYLNRNNDAVFYIQVIEYEKCDGTEVKYTGKYAPKPNSNYESLGTSFKATELDNCQFPL